MQINLMSFGLTFRKKIIIVVVGLATVPLVLFGMNALRAATRFQAASEQVRNRLLFSLLGQMEDYFARINESLAFVQRIESRDTDESQINRILFNAFNSSRELASAGHLVSGRITAYYGGDMDASFQQRLSTLIDAFREARTLHFSEAYEVGGTLHFDMLYPLRGREDEALFLTYSLEEPQRKLAANSIDDTGEFAMVSGSGALFAGSPDLKRRFAFMEIGGALSSAGGGVIEEDIKGYRVRGTRLNVEFPVWLLFSQRRREADALVTRLRTGMLLFLLIMLGASAFLSFMLASGFSRPISSLLTAAKENYSAGEPVVKARLADNDRGELAMLINGFNEMVDGLKAAREKLVEKEKLAAVGEMSNIIGHDIRNPLAAIKNGVYFIRYSVKSENERLSKTLNIIDREIENITEIIENLLGYSRQRPPALKPVDVNSLTDESVSIVDVPENVEIRREFSEALGEHNLDKGEMKQVLVNLINNAVQACSDKESGVVTIRTDRTESGELFVSIKDNGKGIPRDKLENIFKAFYSTKEGGTGLGMSSAKNIVERHEGTINVKSELNKGTEIMISIPQLKRS